MAFVGLYGRGAMLGWLAIRNKLIPTKGFQMPQTDSKWNCVVTGFCGMVLLAAFSFKVLDELFFLKLSMSTLFSASVFVDLMAGSLLFANTSSAVSSMVGCVVFFVYAGYQIFFASKTCDCFGQISNHIGSFSHFGLTIGCAGMCAYVTYVRYTKPLSLNSIESAGWMTGFAKQSGLVASTVCALLFIRQMQDYPTITGVIRRPVFEEGSMKIRGEIRVKNDSKDAVVLLGNLPNKCKGGIKIEGPVEVEPGKYVELEGVFVPSNKGIFVTGSSDVVISNNGVARYCKMN